jgi:LysM repeat protein
MKKQPRKLRVFLCYTSTDKPKVLELYRRLLREDWIDPWIDKEKILPGQHWSTVIRQSLSEADSVIIFISKKSTTKESFVQREMNLAWELSLNKPRGTIYLIPLRLENCEVPFDLRERQWVDYFGENQEQTYRLLLKSLKARHEQKLKEEIDNKSPNEEFPPNPGNDTLNFSPATNLPKINSLEILISKIKINFLQFISVLGNIPQKARVLSGIFIILTIALFVIGSLLPSQTNHITVTQTKFEIPTESRTPTPTRKKQPTTSPSKTATFTPTYVNPTSLLDVRPATYTLQKGEFPFCIARRFNVDPDALLQASGLTSDQAYSMFSGMVLTIPKNAAPFPGNRALQSHPATYTVVAGDTVYSVACKFGDVEPNAIASANNISVTATLTAGQQLQIP